MSASDPSSRDQTYWIPIVIFLGVYTGAGSSVRGHGLITIFPEVEYILLLVVMHTLDNLRTNQGALGNNTFQGNHVVEMCRAERSRVAREFTEAARVGTVVHLNLSTAIEATEVSVILTTSSPASLEGRFGNDWTTCLSAWSKAWENSKGCDMRLSCVNTGSVFCGSECLPFCHLLVVGSDCVQ